MDKLIIDDYYPALPNDATLEQRLTRQMLKTLEEKEFLDRIDARMRRVAIQCGETYHSPLEKYSPIYGELKRNIRKRTGTYSDR